MTPKEPIIASLLVSLTVMVLVSSIIFLYNPNVIIDRTVTPADHAIYGVVAQIPPGAGTYCIHAETLSRGEPVTVGLHYIISVPTAEDRFGATKREQRGLVFTTDNDHVVNETVVVPDSSTDGIITVSYTYYTDENKVHIKVEKCGNSTVSR